ncbi:MAG: hypothetical protein LBC68_02295 [Prevotellaceae bacterium]|jgi:hypothetical protein|nr:hypothetical protein [Prevotellaceae bacterium]
MIKKCVVFGLFFISFVAVYYANFVFADSVPNVGDIFAGVMKSRQLIQKGVIEVDYLYSNVSGYVSSKHWKIYFDDSKKRSDITQNYHIDTICFDCYSKKTILYYTNQFDPDEEGRRMALCFYDGYKKPSISLYIPDPRWFGYTAFTLENSIYENPLEIYGSKIDDHKPAYKIFSDSCNGIDCWRIDFKLETISPYSLWLAKSDLNRVICLERHFEVDEGEKIIFIDRVESETEKFQGEIWFPTKLRYRRTENGKVTMRLDATIKVISLNEPLPPNTFYPKGVDFLKPDTPVVWALDRDRPAEEGELVWNGEEVVPVVTTSKATLSVKSVGDLKIRIFFVLFGLAMIFIGVGIKVLQSRISQNKNE